MLGMTSTAYTEMISIWIMATIRPGSICLYLLSVPARVVLARWREPVAAF